MSYWVYTLCNECKKYRYILGVGCDNCNKSIKELKKEIDKND